MKLSKKEKLVATAIVNMKQLEFTLDDVCAHAGDNQTEHHRAAMSVTMRSLQRKLLTNSIFLRRATKLGRGYKALYAIDKASFIKMRAAL